MAYDTAARVQELCDLNVADIRAANPITVTIRGKGSKTRYVPLMEPTAQLVLDYLEHVDPHPSLDADTSPLFHGPHHSRLTRSGIAKLLVRHVRAVRARDPSWAPSLPITPHTLRRTRAMHLIQAGVNLIYIRDLLGHADVATTEVYARADAETKRKAIENASAIDPRRTTGLDRGPVPDRLARLARTLTQPVTLCGQKQPPTAPLPAETVRQGA